MGMPAVPHDLRYNRTVGMSAIDHNDDDNEGNSSELLRKEASNTTIQPFACPLMARVFTKSRFPYATLQQVEGFRSARRFSLEP